MALDQVLISEISNRLSKKRTEKVPKVPSVLKMKTFMIQTCVVLRLSQHQQTNQGITPQVRVTPVK